MDANTLKMLKAAYEATPENLHLLPVLLAALWERGEVRPAYEYLRDKPPGQWPPEADRRVPVEICLEVGEPYKALAFIGDAADPVLLLLKARALAALELLDQARAAYSAALAANATLEDPELGAALGLSSVAQPAPAPESAPALPPSLADLLGDDENEEGDEDDPSQPTPAIHRDDATGNALFGLLSAERPAVTFADVGGLGGVKKEIHRRIIMPFIKPRLFERFRKRVGGGIMLYGPPGCGKTLLARATAGECHARFFNVAISDILSMWLGESESRLHALFEKARQAVPAVIFFDEIEALGGKRQYAHDTASGKLVSQFLSELDGFAQNNQGVLILAATNVPWAVDPAFRRPGRFDRVLFVPPPDAPAREAVLAIMLRDRPGAEVVDLPRIAQRTSGFSGADLGNLVESAADLAIEASLEDGSEVPLSTALLLRALDEVRPTTLEWLTTARNYARYANEAGHYDEVLDFLKRHGKE